MLGIVLEGCNLKEAAAAHYLKGAVAGCGMSMFLYAKATLETSGNLLSCGGKVVPTETDATAFMWLKKASAVMQADAADDTAEPLYLSLLFQACILLDCPDVLEDVRLAHYEAHEVLDTLFSVCVRDATFASGEATARFRLADAAERLGKETLADADKKAEYFAEAAAQYKLATYAGHPGAPEAHLALTGDAVPAQPPAPAPAPTPAAAAGPVIEELADDPTPPAPLAHVVSHPSAPVEVRELSVPVRDPPKPAAAQAVPAPPVSVPAPVPEAVAASPAVAARPVAQAPQAVVPQSRPLALPAGVGETSNELLAQLMEMVREQAQKIDGLASTVQAQQAMIETLQEEVGALREDGGSAPAVVERGVFNRMLLARTACLSADLRTFICKKGTPACVAVSSTVLRAGENTAWQIKVDATEGGCWHVAAGVIPRNHPCPSVAKPGVDSNTYFVDNNKKLRGGSYSQKTHATAWESSWLKNGAVLSLKWWGERNAFYFSRVHPEEVCIYFYYVTFVHSSNSHQPSIPTARRRTRRLWLPQPSRGS